MDFVEIRKKHKNKSNGSPSEAVDGADDRTKTGQSAEIAGQTSVNSVAPSPKKTIRAAAASAASGRPNDSDAPAAGSGGKEPARAGTAARGRGRVASLVGQIDFIGFMLGREEYVVRLKDIQEIIKIPRKKDRTALNLTVVPNTPPYIIGIISLRGSIIPIIDLSLRLGIGATVIGQQSRIVVIDHHDAIAGFLVDSVDKVIGVNFLKKNPEDQYRPKPPPATLTGINTNFFEGIERVEYVSARKPTGDADGELHKEEMVIRSLDDDSGKTLLIRILNLSEILKIEV